MEIHPHMFRSTLLAACVALAGWSGTLALAAENAPAPSEPAKDAPAGAPAFSVKNTFRNICGFCHENYGRKAGKGPQLMGTQLTDQQIFDRIKNGKPGRMAAFGGNFTDDQIRQIVAFIRGLRPDVDP
jgi:mono/diheme cytochrome c family protein